MRDLLPFVFRNSAWFQLISPQVPEMVVYSSDKDINPVGSPGDCGGVALKTPANPVPAAPMCAVPPLMSELTIGARSKYVETVLTPRGDRRT